MFKLIDNAISPHKALFKSALQQLPDAHAQAERAGVEHIFHHVHAAGEAAGLDMSPLVIHHSRGALSVGIDGSEAGDRLADAEYGLPDEPPNPVLRTAAHSAKEGAHAKYRETLSDGIGLNL